MIICTFSSALLRFLNQYGIDHKIVNENIMINNDEPFNQLILNNDFDMMEEIKSDIRRIQLQPSFHKSLFSLAPIEFIKYAKRNDFLWFMDFFCPDINHEINILKCICSRPDDNIQVFQFYTKHINFPHGYSTLNDTGSYNLSEDDGILLVLSVAINHGNYHIFIACAEMCGFTEINKHRFGKTEKYKSAYRFLKKTIMDSKVFNPKIWDFIRDYTEITVSDIEYLMREKMIPQLEYVIDLMESGIIDINENEFVNLIENAISPEIKELWVNKN
jgi:hypothetical protein